jgi:hypothetical protein
LVVQFDPKDIPYCEEYPVQEDAGVDAGFNTLVRPAMYGSYHHIIVANKMGCPETETYDVVGPICESRGGLAKERKMNPRQLAQEVLQELDVSSWCEKVEIAGAGFLNFSLKISAVAEGLQSAARGENLFFEPCL